MRGLVLMLLGACSVRADWPEGYRCDDGVCPAGQACVAGFCQTGAEPDATAPDAPASDLDATPGAPDATPPDAAPPDATPLPPNLLANPGLELGDDGSWEPFQSWLLTTTMEPHEGLMALKVCKEDSGILELYTVYQNFIASGPIDLGARYVASIWVRASYLAAEVPPAGLVAALREYGGVDPSRDVFGAPALGLSTTWVELTVELTIDSADRDHVTLIVLPTEDTADGSCFVIDDAYVYRAD